MKVLRLDKNCLNIQKCLVSDCDFAKENCGRHCLVKTSETDCNLIVKIGLCSIKRIDQAIFLDDSVSTFSSFEKINRPCFLRDINFDNFTTLNKPVIAKAVKVIISFADVFDVKQYKNDEAKLKKVVKDILKLFTFCANSSIFLNNLPKCQNFGINCIIVLDADRSKGTKIYEVDSNTEIIIQRCVSQLQLEQSQNKKNVPKIGGCNRVYEILKEVIEFSKCCDKEQGKLLKKLLLIGPTGCGKTTLVHNIAQDCKCILLEISASDINSLGPSDVEKELINVFEKAKIYAENNESCIILIEDIDLMSVGKTSHSKRFVGQLINLLEGIEKTPGIVVIATTNSPDDVDAQLRRPKRLEDELEIMIPTADEREDIIRKILNNCKVACSENVISQLSKWTPGFVGADLRLVILEALMITRREENSLRPSNDSLLQDCFKQALTKVVPSALRGALGLCTARDTTFSQIGGLEEIKKILDLSVRQQLQNPEKFYRLGIPLTKGILLYGPPGCAKTTLVKALAKECNTTFLATSAADLYSPFVGDAEKKIVQLFSQARIGSPSIVFIDEIDAIVGSKSGDRERGVQERILSTLLVEMDGVGIKVNIQRDNSLNLLGRQLPESEKENAGKEINNGVVVVGATNRPQLLDDALKRPGRFDRLLYVPPPDESERLRILQKLTERMPLHESVNLHQLAKLTNFYSGADLKNFCQETGLHALKSSDMTATCIHHFHFEHVLAEYKPSLTAKTIKFYESFQKYNV